MSQHSPHSQDRDPSSSAFVSLSVQQRRASISREKSLDHTKSELSRARSRSLSVSLAQDANARRAGNVVAKKRVLNREVSMSRVFKGKKHDVGKDKGESERSSAKELAVKAITPKTRSERVDEGVTLVSATPVKAKSRPRIAQAPALVSQSKTGGFDISGEDEEDIWKLP